MEHFYRYYLLVVGLLGAFVSFLVYFGIHDANTSIAERRFTSAVSLYHTSLERLLHQTSGASDGRNTISTDSNALTLLRKALGSENISLVKVSIFQQSNGEILLNLKPDARLQEVNSLKYESMIRTPDNGVWVLQVTPTETYLRHFYIANSAWMLAGSLLFTTGVLVFLVLNARRTRDIQLLAQKRGEELEAVNRKLELLSLTDALTALVNRRGFDQTLDLEWNRAIRDKNPLTLLIIDVDNFKAFNDHYGHIAGDNCLIEVGAVIGKVPFRLGDVVARYGGEEFAVILPNTDDRKGIVAERCRRAVERMQIRHVSSDIAHVVTVSVGESTQWPHREGDPLQLLSEADDALYRAKDAGRNRIEVAKAEPALVTDGGQASTPLKEY